MKKHHMIVASLLSLAMTQAIADPLSEPAKKMLIELGAPVSAKTEMRTIAPGLIEIAIGKDIIYTTPDMKYAIIGATVVDLDGKKNITQLRVDELSVIDVSALDKAKTLRFVNGSGKNMLYVFTDPLCPYCRKSEAKAFDAEGNFKIADTTMVLIPVALPMHPESRQIIEAVFCAEAPEKAWQAAMKGDPKGAVEASQSLPRAKSCDDAAKVESINTDIMKTLGINHTPAFFDEKGKPVRPKM